MTSAVKTPPPEQPPSQPATRPPRFKRATLFTAFGLTALGACYLGGWWVGHAQVTRLRAEIDAVRENASAELGRCSAQGASLQRAGRMLEARRQLDLAVEALDARNFGIAEQLVKKSARWLVSAPVEGPAAALAKTLESYRLTATEDVGAQRKQLNDWIGQLDPLIVLPAP